MSHIFSHQPILRENLEATRRLRPGVERQAVDRIIDRLRLSPYADRRAGTLSPGIGSYVIVALSSLIGLLGTFLWWEWADQAY